MVCALGLEHRLLAVSHECDYPPSVRHLPRLTRSRISADMAPPAIDQAVREAARAGRPLYLLDQDLLGRLGPGLVVTQGVCAVCAVDAETVRACPLPDEVCLVSLEGVTFAGILQDIRRLARAAGVAPRGEELISALEERWRALPGAREEAEGPVPRVVVLEWTQPPFATGHWVPEMVAAAGGCEVLAGPGQASRRLEWAEVAGADPDLVVVAACGYGLEDNVRLARELYRQEQTKGLRALDQGNLWAVDANAYFSRPGPRLVRGAEILAGILRGQEARGEACRVEPP
jgi:iron complex transport system substrate-binding protein